MDNYKKLSEDLRDLGVLLPAAALKAVGDAASNTPEYLEQIALYNDAPMASDAAILAIRKSSRIFTLKFLEGIEVDKTFDKYEDIYFLLLQFEA